MRRRDPQERVDEEGAHNFQYHAKATPSGKRKNGIAGKRLLTQERVWVREGPLCEARKTPAKGRKLYSLRVGWGTAPKGGGNNGFKPESKKLERGKGTKGLSVKGRFLPFQKVPAKKGQKKGWVEKGGGGGVEGE